MKHLLIFSLLFGLIVPFGIFADQDKSKTINSDLLKKIQKSFKIDSKNKALHNAITNNQLKALFYNREVLKNHNTNYSHEIKTGIITAQKGTGRCWMYAGLNTIRPEVIKRLNMKKFEFSTNYYFFWDRFEKANHFLERAIIKADLNIRSLEYQKFLGGDHLGDGGYWQNAVDIIKKYGAVPMSAMPEVNSNESSRSLNSVLSFLLKNMAYDIKVMKKKGKSISELRTQKIAYLKQVYKILVLHLGEPVKSFPFRYYKTDKNGKKALTAYKTYTPKSFSKEFILENLDDYVMFANWPARKFYKFYEWEGSNNVIEGTRLNFINLPMSEIKKMAVNSIKNNIPVNFSADVGKQMDSKKGIMNADLFNYSEVYNIPFNTAKKSNTLLKNINSTHAMVFQGVDIKDGKPLKWKVENSWGSKSGNGGYYALYDNWFDLYVVRIVIHKKFIPKKILKLLKSKPILIPDTQPEK